MDGLRFALVGPGRVGSSLARWLLAAGARLEAVAGREAAPLPRWAAAAGARRATVNDLATAGCELLLLAVPDAAVAPVASRLAARRQADVALHAGGLLSAVARAPLRAAGSAVGGFHPRRASPRPRPRPALAHTTFIALQGDAAAVTLGARLAAAIGAPHAEVPAAARALYHLAATWAGGGTVTLVGAAVDLHARAGVAPAAAAGLVELARGALAGIDAAAPMAALSGPIARGEGTYLDQLAALRATAPELHPLAVLVALEGLRQLAARAPLTPSQMALRSTLCELCEQSSFLDPLRTWV